MAESKPSEKTKFIQKNYTHLAGAVGAFIVLEFLLFQTRIAASLTQFVLSSRFYWVSFLSGFAVLGWLFRGFAEKADSISTQYLGLGFYVVGEA